MPDLFGPDIRNSIFAHIVHVLLIGGVVGYGWSAVKALVRKPTSVGRALRHGVYGAWLFVLLLLLTRANPLPYLPAAATIATILILFSLWDRLATPAKDEVLLTSGAAEALRRDGELSPAAVRAKRD